MGQVLAGAGAMLVAVATMLPWYKPGAVTGTAGSPVDLVLPDPISGIEIPAGKIVFGIACVAAIVAAIHHELTRPSAFLTSLALGVLTVNIVIILAENESLAVGYGPYVAALGGVVAIAGALVPLRER